MAILSNLSVVEAVEVQPIKRNLIIHGTFVQTEF